MAAASATSFDWVVLTMGDRPTEVERAIRSLLASEGVEVVVVANGASDAAVPELSGVRVVLTDENLGVPAGRDVGVQATRSPIVGFLDDDARLCGGVDSVLRAFETDPKLGAVALRIVDDEGVTAPRHVPRPGGMHPQVGGPVAHFLGGACAIRRAAYDEVGGYFTDLFYGHEELELSWRLLDAGWRIEYLADVVVQHPRTEIGRHEHGWELTGRNRVWVARRTLPWPVAIVHVVLWLLLGLVRAPTGCRRAYLRGWGSGWTTRWSSGASRRPVRWTTVWRLVRLGRPPII